MNKKEIRAAYVRQKKELKLHYHRGKGQRRFSHRARLDELRYRKRAAEKGPARQALKKAIKAEKRSFKREAYLQKSIYLEHLAALKKTKRDALGSLVKLVTEHAPESLSGRLTLGYVLIFLIFALLQGVFVIGASYYVMDRRAAETLVTAAETLQAAGLREEIAEVLAEEYGMNITLYRADETLLYSYGLGEPEQTLPYNRTWNRPFSYRHQADTLRIYSTEAEVDGTRYYLNLAKSMQTENALISVVINLLLLSIVVAVSVSYVVGHRTTRNLLRPIGVLGRAMEEMSAASLSERLETEHIHTELVEVVEAYNRMLDNIESAYLRQKQFVSNASHELRTPLAVISGYSDILARWGASDPKVSREAIDAIVTQAAYMQTLLDRLLYIARSENGTMQANPAQTALAPLCAEVLQDFRMMYPTRRFDLSGYAVAWCDPDLTRQILVILLDNSAKFTASDSTITVLLETDGDQTRLSVEDNGVGMTEEVAAHVFERFFKGDSSHNEKGFGLGLSIARLIAEAQGGRIEVTSAPGVGSRFTVTLPKEAS